SLHRFKSKLNSGRMSLYFSPTGPFWNVVSSGGSGPSGAECLMRSRPLKNLTASGGGGSAAGGAASARWEARLTQVIKTREVTDACSTILENRPVILSLPKEQLLATTMVVPWSSAPFEKDALRIFEAIVVYKRADCLPLRILDIVGQPKLSK